MVFRLGELFCGPGGLAYGAMHSNINQEDFRIVHQWATDYDVNTCKTYIRNICPEDPDSVICHDIRTLDYKELHNKGAIDGLAFGFPCNDFSVVGEQKGVNGKFGPLYTYGIRALKEFKPLWFLAENVGGLKSANGGNADYYFEDLCENKDLTTYVINFIEKTCRAANKSSVPQPDGVTPQQAENESTTETE